MITNDSAQQSINRMKTSVKVRKNYPVIAFNYFCCWWRIAISCSDTLVTQRLSMQHPQTLRLLITWQVARWEAACLQTITLWLRLTTITVSPVRLVNWHLFYERKKISITSDSIWVSLRQWTQLISDTSLFNSSQVAASRFYSSYVPI